MAFAYLSMKQNTHIDKKNCKATRHTGINEEGNAKSNWSFN